MLSPDQGTLSSSWPFALVIFLIALTIRALFLLATPDFGGPISPYYKGDTFVWLEYAAAIQSSANFTHGLPLRPPGVAYLIALFWDGQATSFLTLKLLWITMSAASVAIFYLVIVRCFGSTTGIVAALYMAGSTGLIIAATSPNNETPYLLLISVILYYSTTIARQPAWRDLALWSLLNALACLIRVEHILFFMMSCVWLLWIWSTSAASGQLGQWLRKLGFCGAVFILTLLPWQLHTWSNINQFNHSPLVLDKQTEAAYQALERSLSAMQWTPGARAESAALPAFTRRTLTNFVAASVATRGRQTITARDFDIIDEAFGYRPEPISPFSFIAIYGGLNFYLANNSTALGGFTLTALDKPPPLLGGSSQYPGFLINGLPPKDLNFTYPPHVQALNHGYGLGWEWIGADPSKAIELVTNKMEIFWSGVFTGFTGYNLPLGLSGTRGAVDMVVAKQSGAKTSWYIVGYIVLFWSVWLGRHLKELYPWIILLTTKLVTTTLFYGYAREGVVVLPVFALLFALLIARLINSRSLTNNSVESGLSSRWHFGAFILFTVLVCIEISRYVSETVLYLDGQEVGILEPFPIDDSNVRYLHID